MTQPITAEADQPVDGVVKRLARDDLERKNFLKMAGKRMGAGAAATGLAAFIAACGSSSSSSSTPSSSSSAAAAGGTGDRERQQVEFWLGRSRDRQLRADTGVPGVAVLREGAGEWPVSRRDTGRS